MPIDANLLLASDPIGSQNQGFNYGRKIMDLAANQQAGSQFASGDYGGATTTLAQSGNLPAAQQMQQYGQKSGQAGLAYVASALPIFQQIAQVHANDPDKGAAALGDAFDHIAPEAKMATGVSDQQLATFRQLLTSDPQGAIARMQAQIPVEWQKVGNDTLIGTAPGGRIAGTVQASNIMTAGPGQQVVQTPLTINGQPVGGAPQPQTQAQPQPASTSQQPAPQPQQTASNAPLGIRSNNPGNLMPAGQEATYSNMTAGIIAAGQNLDAYARQGINTLTGIVNRWAPAAAGNNTQAYIQDIAQRLGVDPNQPLNLSDPNVKGAVLEAMFQHENGQQPQVGGAQIALAPQGAAPQQQSGDARVLYSGGPVWRNPTPEEAAAHPGVSQVNAATGELKFPPSTMMPSLLSDAAIKQGAAQYIQNGGRMPVSARDRASQAAILSAVADLKPEGMSDGDWARVIQNNLLSFDAKKSAGNQAAKGQIMTAVNEGTVNNSIGILRQLIPVAASQGNFTDINSLQQFIGRHTNDAQAANFKNAIDSISAEYARVMTGATNGSASSDSARAEAAHRILDGYNKNTIPQVLDQMQAEMRGRSASYAQVMQQLTGGGYTGPDVPGANTPANNGGNGGAPNLTPGSTYKGLPVLTPAAVLKLKPGQQFYGTDGVLRAKK